MIDPVRPWCDADRQAALRSYAILDTLPEAEFDGIARLAMMACQAPIALVNFLAEDRQWFKAEAGFGRRETPISIAFCAHAIRQPPIFVVPDAQVDERFATNPLVTNEPHIRFYAGALVLSDTGVPIGTVCVLDRKPREGLTLEQGETLLILAQQVTTILGYRKTLAARSRPDTRASKRA